MKSTKLSPAMKSALCYLLGLFQSDNWGTTSLTALEKRGLIQDLGFTGPRNARAWFITDEARAIVGAPMNVVAPVVEAPVVEAPVMTSIDAGLDQLSTMRDQYLAELDQEDALVQAPVVEAPSNCRIIVRTEKDGIISVSPNMTRAEADREQASANASLPYSSWAEIETDEPTPAMVAIREEADGALAAITAPLPATVQTVQVPVLGPVTDKEAATWDVSAATRMACWDGLLCRFHATGGSLLLGCSAVHSVLVINTPAELAMSGPSTTRGDLVPIRRVPITSTDQDGPLDQGNPPRRIFPFLLVDDPLTGPSPTQEQRAAVVRWFETTLARREYPPPMFGYGIDRVQVIPTKDWPVQSRFDGVMGNKAGDQSWRVGSILLMVLLR